MSEFRVEWCGRVKVYVPVKDTDPKPQTVEVSPRNSFLRSLRK